MQMWPLQGAHSPEQVPQLRGPQFPLPVPQSQLKVSQVSQQTPPLQVPSQVGHTPPQPSEMPAVFVQPGQVVPH
jgi:hypothetical protein